MNFFNIINNSIKNKKDYLCVWGSGYIGLSTACHFAKLGKNVLALDTNKKYVENLKKGQLKNDDFKNWLKIIIFKLSSFKIINIRFVCIQCQDIFS